MAFQIPIYQVDAFTDRPFAGNPAAVCPLERGHATLASAFVVFTQIDPQRTRVVFWSRSGPLTVARDRGRDRLVMDFPSRPPRPIPPPDSLADALGAPPVAVLAARDLVAVFDSADVVRGLRPDFAAIAALDAYAVCATAPGTGADTDVDFVSRLSTAGCEVIASTSRDKPCWSFAAPFRFPEQRTGTRQPAVPFNGCATDCKQPFKSSGYR